MSDENMVDRLLADLKRRFALGNLTYAEAVMVEDLIAAISEINDKADVCHAESAVDICPSGEGESDGLMRPHKS